jgi:hypothetical protein
MHPDKPGYIDELHAYFRGILVGKLNPVQLQLHDYFSSQDPLYSGADCFDEFPLVDGLPEGLMEDLEDEELPYVPTEEPTKLPDEA